MNINNHVRLATPAELRAHYRNYTVPKLAKYMGGGRGGTVVNCLLYEFARKFGDPHEAAPKDDWYCYDLDLLGDGKVSAEWFVVTPRGMCCIHDYWWNKRNILSINTASNADSRAMLWCVRWLRNHGLDARFGIIKDS